MLSATLIEIQKKRFEELQVSIKRLKKEIQNLEDQKNNFKQEALNNRALFDEVKFNLIKRQEELRKALVEAQRESIDAQEYRNKLTREREAADMTLRSIISKRISDPAVVQQARSALEEKSFSEKAGKELEEKIWNKMTKLGSDMNHCAEEILEIETRIRDQELDLKKKIDDLTDLSYRIQVILEMQQREAQKLEQLIAERIAKQTH